MIRQVGDSVFTFPITLPNNPLKWLNCYVIRGAERSLLIDTGFNTKCCLDELLAGMKALGLFFEKTDVFLTHLHADHTGNAGALYDLGCEIMIEQGELEKIRDENAWSRRGVWMGKEGMPENIFREIMKKSPAIIYAPGHFEAETVKDGDILRYGGYELRCIATPGHSGGHMCLYDGGKKLLFSGDHVLFDITPNICSAGPGSDRLGDYLDSLSRMAALETELCLPAHRTQGNISLASRAGALIAHHRARIEEIENYISENPGHTAYHIAGHIQWRISAKSWEDFPISQKWFAVSETLAHLDYLRLRRQVQRRENPQGLFVYFK